MIGVEHKMLSPAKINWTLRVLRRRDDGFHEIESLVSTVAMCDELTFSLGGDAPVVLTCDDPGVPVDERNLIWRAATVLADRAGRDPEVTCHLVKRIPAGGGLGGGSSNAAAALIALNRMWGLDWPVERLVPLAAELGSDVPFFLRGGSAVMTGRGERIRPARVAWNGWVVLLLPGIHVSTAEVYAAWEPSSSDSGVMEAVPEADTDRGMTAGEWMACTFNMLEAPAHRVCPSLRDIQTRALEMAGRAVRMSGSGSSMFTAFDARGEADGFAQRVRDELGIRAEVVQPSSAGVPELNS